MGRRNSVLLALIDLTRMAYFGPAVLSLFLLGALLAMPGEPQWSPLLRVLVAGMVGFSGGFVLNDWADRGTDKVILSARMRNPDYARQLRRERPFTGTRPIAAGIVSPSLGLAFAAALIAVSAAVAFSFPSPHRWYVIGALAFNAVAEPLYCTIKRSQSRFPAATFFHAALLGICPMAAYLALRRPDLTAIGLFGAMYLWEVGFNQLYDTVDAENDRRRGIATMSAAFGLRPVAGWCLVLSVLTTAAFLWVWHTSGAGSIVLAGVCTAALLLIGTDALLLARPRLRLASSAISIHQGYVILIMGAVLLETVLRWLSLR